MNTEFLIHALSFLILAGFIFWRSRAYIKNLLENRIATIENNVKTAAYIKNLSIKALSHEHKHQKELPSILKHMEHAAKKKVSLYEKDIEKNIATTTQRWLGDFDIYMKKTNFKIVDEIKDEITHKFIVKLINVMRRDIPSTSLLKEVKKFIHKF